MTQNGLCEDKPNGRLFNAPVPRGVMKTFPQYLAAALGTLGAFSLGSCMSWSSSAIPMLQKADSDIRITGEQGAWIGSILTLGGFIGAVPAGMIISKFGPKRTLQASSFPIFASWILIAYSGCVWGICGARFVAGMALGAVTVAAPMYVAELAEPKIRGRLGSLFQLQLTCGILFEYILGGSVEDFRILALISSLIPVVFLVTFSFMPESPVYLSCRGNTKQARINLQWFRGEDYSVEDEMCQIQNNIREACSSKTKLSDLTRCKATSRALVVSLGLMVFQQLSGITALLFYTGKIFEEAGSSISPNTCAVLVGVVQVCATYLSTFLIDRAGRRFVLIVSSSVMSLCLGVLGLYFYMQSVQDMSSFSMVPLASLELYIVVYSIGFGPVPWIMMGELFSSKVSRLASSISASFNWSLSFLVTKTFQDMLAIFGAANTFYTFSLISAIGCVFVYFIVPETKGKDINEIRKALGAKTCDNLDHNKAEDTV